MRKYTFLTYLGNKIQDFLEQYLFQFKEKEKMIKDSYNMRLREIREKYGASVQDTTPCLKQIDRPIPKSQLTYEQKYTSVHKIRNQNRSELSQNISPYTTGFNSKCTNQTFKDIEPIKKYDSSFLSNTQSRDERLKQIEKIRENFAQSRKKAINEWTREVEKSKNKYVDDRKGGYDQKRINAPLSTLNQNLGSFNPEDFTSSKRDHHENLTELFRAKTQSSYTSHRAKQDESLSSQLKRNYDYSKDSHNALSTQQSWNKEIPDVKKSQQRSYQRQGVSSYISKDYSDIQSTRKEVNTGKYDRKRVENIQDYSYQSSSLHQMESETTSPIRGLMRFDSVQKIKRPQTHESTNYNLNNIDKIQQRIQSILNKK